MHVALQNGIDVLAVVGQCSGVPFVGGAAAALASFLQSCDNVKVQREQAKSLIRQCTEHLILMQDNQKKLEGTDLQTAADELEAVLQTATRKMKEWSRYNAVKAYWNQDSIAKGIQEWQNQLMTVVTSFQMKCQIDTRAAVRDDTQERQRDVTEIKDLLIQVLSNQQSLNEVRDMGPQGLLVAERLMEDGQEELYHHPRDSQRYLECQRGLLNLHQTTGVPPALKDLSYEITRQGTDPMFGGTFSDVWIGTWLGGRKVALKGLRNVRVSQSAAKRFNQEIKVWSKLKHDNVLPLLGYVRNQGLHIHTVAPWQQNGNVLEFVKLNPMANKLKLLFGAARGLQYLHSLHIVHGNVKCSNILVTEEGEACVCDFGLSMIVGEITDTAASAALTAQGSARWLAPELIEGSVNSPTFYSDVYGFSMAILELLTGQHPFSNRKRDAAVIRDVVLNRARPTRPSPCDFLTDDLWQLMEKCWDSVPDSRPSMSEVTRVLELSTAQDETHQHAEDVEMT